MSGFQFPGQVREDEPRAAGVATYSIVGLGKLGAPMVAAIASRGFSVVGVDISEEAVRKLAAGLAPVEETGLEDLIAANRARISATTDMSRALRESEVTFVVVPTPSESTGAFSTRYVESVCRSIGRALREKDEYHLVALTSTVLPGETRKMLKLLEEESGTVCGEDFGLCYSPEFIALGTVIQDFLNPDLLLIGESDEQAGALLESCYQRIMENGAPCRRMSFENAELAKIAVNSFVTMKIAFANTLADLCEQLPGGDVDLVTGALGLDRRIGPYYLKGGLGFGGPCFPRDNKAFAFAGGLAGVESDLAVATDHLNNLRPARIVKRIVEFLEPGTRVAVLGIAYKAGTGVVEQSQGLEIARLLGEAGAEVAAWDPLGAANPALSAGQLPMRVTDKLEDALSEAELVVVASPIGDLASVLGSNRPRVIFDCWRTIDADSLPEDVVVVSLGIGDS
jgi:UDPglucose 6-dehydrogenase